MKEAIGRREIKLRPLTSDQRRAAENRVTELGVKFKELRPRRRQLLTDSADRDLAQILEEIPTLQALLNKKEGRKGRPREEDDDARIAKQFAVSAGLALGRTWKEMAFAVGLSPTKANLRTLRRQQDKLRVFRVRINCPAGSIESCWRSIPRVFSKRLLSPRNADK
jgi:hypothetical protein